MLRARDRSGPRSPSLAPRTARPETKDHRQRTIQSGMPHLSRTRRSQGSPTRSNARDWSATASQSGGGHAGGRPTARAPPHASGQTQHGDSSRNRHQPP
eukprot:467708-Alexandrium_andersonii.AAC.1